MAMTFTQTHSQQHEKNLLKLQNQMKSLQNEMEFVEILAQFWPLPNMAQKMDRLEKRMTILNQQYQFYKAGKSVA